MVTLAIRLGMAGMPMSRTVSAQAHYAAGLAEIFAEFAG
jgi:hypothetical protein